MEKDRIKWGYGNPHPLSSMNIELVWQGSSRSLDTVDILEQCS